MRTDVIIKSPDCLTSLRLLYIMSASVFTLLVLSVSLWTGKKSIYRQWLYSCLHHCLSPGCRSPLHLLWNIRFVMLVLLLWHLSFEHLHAKEHGFVFWFTISLFGTFLKHGRSFYFSSLPCMNILCFCFKGDSRFITDPLSFIKQKSLVSLTFISCIITVLSNV